MLQIIKKMALLSALVVLGACGSSVGVSDGSEETESGQELSLCDKVLAGEVIQAPDGEFEVCQFESSYEGLTSAATLGQAEEASFVLSGFGIGKLKVLIQ